MMAKITKGSAFAGAVKYIFAPEKQTELLAAEGVQLKNVESVARSFEAQRQLNTRVTRPVGHISLDFSAQDRERLDNATMIAIAQEYMERMGIRDTQFLIGRHYDREHPHIHLLYNRVDNNGRTISDQHDRTLSTKICRELTEKLDNNQSAPLPPQKHLHTVELKSSKVVVALVSLGVTLLSSMSYNIYQFTANSRLSDNDIKFRYIKAFGEITPENLLKLETIYEYEPDKQQQRSIRQMVEEHEQRVEQRARDLEQARLKEAKAERLRKEAETLKNKK